MKPITIDRLFELGISISAEKDKAKLFGNILNEAMDMTGSDAGTLYILNDDRLDFNYMITRSKGVDFSADRGEIKIPPVPLGRGHICACCALDKDVISVPDVYASKDYDFSGAQRYDAMNEYHTGNMLVAPMLDKEDNCIGVLQLINGDFDSESENMIRALASFAAVSLDNKLMAQEINDLLHSVVKMMVSAIDARSPYNANHTKNMAYYGEQFLNWACEHKVYDYTPEERDAIIMGIWLHDVGKLVIPLEVMDKATRLGDHYDKVLHRITVGVLMEEIAALKDSENAQIHLARRDRLNEAMDQVRELNEAGFLPEEKLALVEEIAALSCLDREGNEIPLLSPEEKEDLSIRRGTLNAKERSIIESHVSYTKSMLKELALSKRYKKVPVIAGDHHEYIDGSGYPEGKSGGEISREARLLAIIDIFDALTAEDRPYKPPMPVEKAFGILEDMAGSGKLDGEILEQFKESRAWERRGEAYE